MPSVAQASTASIGGATLTYQAGAAEVNFVTFSVNGPNIRVKEGLSSGPGAPTMIAGAGCVLFDTKTVDCPSAGLTAISAFASDLSDSFANQTSIAGTFNGEDGDDSFDPGPANDTFNGGNGSFTGVTSTGDKVDYQLAASGITATLSAGSATITVPGLGTDTYTGIEVIGGSSNGTTGDTITGDANANQLIGNGGNDVLSSGGGNDNIQGGAGNDVMDGGPGADSIQDSVGGGFDTVTYAGEPSGVSATPFVPPLPATRAFSVSTSTGTDGVYDIENITGSPFADSISGDGVPNTFDGGAGNDTIRGGAGSDSLTGGTNTDTVVFDDLASPVNASLNAGNAVAGADTDTLIGFENLTGGAGADTLEGDAGANVLSGGGGTDTVNYANFGASVSADTAAGTASGTASGNDTLVTVESLIGTAFPDTLKIRDSSQGDVACGSGADLATTNANDTFQPDCETVAPVVTTAPVVSGSTAIGDQLNVTSGTYGGTASTIAYEWQRCDSVGAGCAAIAGATNPSYTIDAADAGHRLRARVAASNAAGGDSGTTGTTAVVPVPAVASTTQPSASPAATQAQPRAGLPDPVFARSVNAEPVSGTVLVKEPGAATFVLLTEPTQIQVGSIIDARRGRVRLTTIDKNGRKQSAEFYEGMFKLFQQRKAGGITELVLFGGSFATCPRKAAPARTGTTSRQRKPSSSVRHLWGSGSGLFRTKGRYSSATIRGTTWLTDDRCNGTLTRVKRGSVTVRDFPHRKSLVLKAPKKYLATPRR